MGGSGRDISVGTCAAGCAQGQLAVAEFDYVSGKPGHLDIGANETPVHTTPNRTASRSLLASALNAIGECVVILSRR